MAEVQVVPTENGPYKVTGPVQLVDPEGNPIRSRDPDRPSSCAGAGDRPTSRSATVRIRRSASRARWPRSSAPGTTEPWISPSKRARRAPRGAARSRPSPRSTRSSALAVRRFVETELRPHATEWEDARWFPNKVFTRLAVAGLPGAEVPARVRRRWRPGRRSGVHRGARPVRVGRPGGRHRRPHRNRAATDLEIRDRGAEAALPGPGDPGREDRGARDHRARRRLGRRRRAHARDPGGRRLAGQRLEDVHHRRRQGRRPRDRGQDDATRAATMGCRS